MCVHTYNEGGSVLPPPPTSKHLKQEPPAPEKGENLTHDRENGIFFWTEIKNVNYSLLLFYW